MRSKQLVMTVAIAVAAVVGYDQFKKKTGN
jgi:hypothetical protein